MAQAVSGKQLWSSGKVWDLGQFLAEYPALGSAIAVLTYQDYAWRLLSNFGIQNFTKYEFDQQVAIFRHQLAYIIAPDKPVTYSYDFVTDDYIARATFWNRYDITIDLWRLMDTGQFDDHNFFAGKLHFSQFISYINYPDSDEAVALFGLFALDLLLPANIKANLIGPDGLSVQFESMRLVQYMRAKRNDIISVAAYRYKFWQARSDPLYMPFSEVYGIADINQVPARTISYVVTNDPPPVAQQDWASANFWSQVFNTDAGRALLNSVASLYPVSTRTVLDWKDPASIDKITSETKDAYMWSYFIAYIFNDFEISIDSKQSILVRYIRKKVNETYQMKYEKESAWIKFLPYAALILVAAIATYGFIFAAAPELGVGASAMDVVAETGGAGLGVEAGASGISVGVGSQAPNIAWSSVLKGLGVVSSGVGLASQASGLLGGGKAPVPGIKTTQPYVQPQQTSQVQQASMFGNIDPTILILLGGGLVVTLLMKGRD